METMSGCDEAAESYAVGCLVSTAKCFLRQTEPLFVILRTACRANQTAYFIAVQGCLKAPRGIGLTFARLADGSQRGLNRHASDPVKPCLGPTRGLPRCLFLSSLT